MHILNCISLPMEAGFTLTFGIKYQKSFWGQTGGEVIRLIASRYHADMQAASIFFHFLKVSSDCIRLKLNLMYNPPQWVRSDEISLVCYAGKQL